MINNRRLKFLKFLTVFGLVIGVSSCVRPQFPQVWTQQKQEALVPGEALRLLQEGNKRHVSGRPNNHHLRYQAYRTSHGQYPFAALVTCIDSRTSAEFLFDQGLGDIFEARVAGSVINTDIAASLEYACYVAGSKVVAIIGHTGCGAVKGACDRVTVGNLPGLLARIEPAVRATETAAGEDRTSHNHEFVDRVARANVVHSVQTLRRISPLLAKMEAEGKITIVGGLYDLDTEEVTFLP